MTENGLHENQIHPLSLRGQDAKTPSRYSWASLNRSGADATEQQIKPLIYEVVRFDKFLNTIKNTITNGLLLNCKT
jgi:hypothetical protein